MISPRCWVLITVSVKELSETYFAKNCSRTAPQRENADALEGRFVEAERQLEAAGEGDGARRSHATKDRAGLNAQHALNLAGGLAVARCV